MYASQILIKKRDKIELTKEEIFFFINQLINNKISDSQVGAFLMASVINGLSHEETAYLTMAMCQSGSHLLYPNVNKLKVDKHSTGGIGDKTSLIIFPICIALNLAFPMITARGLGYTGGTLDKLESILGLRTNLTQEEMNRSMLELGGFIIGQNEEIAPADRKIYKIRDVTVTVEEAALITSSILSKKVAENLDVLVIDVKTGLGAFMKTVEKAKDLGVRLKKSAELLGLKLKVVLSRMDQPLGKSVGNWLEVLEAEKFLKGECEEDLKELIFIICTLMLIEAGVVKDKENAENLIGNVIQNGSALKCFHQMVELQGGNWKKSEEFYQKTLVWEVKAQKTGWIEEINGLSFGMAGVILGFSRRVEGEDINHANGFEFNRKCGDYVKEGEILYKIYASSETQKNEAEDFLKEAVKIVEYKLNKKKVVLEIM